ncbi:hypothetical protein, partial [Salmonella sp. gx-f7]|uniref:hypothetical protein n=1 Tax=Salmonella sp. gx-f7 TaxID=2582606 RepID=UPI001F30BFAB
KKKKQFILIDIVWVAQGWESQTYQFLLFMSTCYSDSCVLQNSDFKVVCMLLETYNKSHGEERTVQSMTLFNKDQ